MENNNNERGIEIGSPEFLKFIEEFFKKRNIPVDITITEDSIRVEAKALKE